VQILPFPTTEIRDFGYPISMQRQRVVIEHVKPQVDAGRFPVKRVAGDSVSVEARIFADGREAIHAMLLHRRSPGVKPWQRVTMRSVADDLWTGSFEVAEPGLYEFTIHAWVDTFETWRRDLRARLDAGHNVSTELLTGARLADEAAARATGKDQEQLLEFAHFLRTDEASELRIPLALDNDLAEIMRRYPEAGLVTEYPSALNVRVERCRASFSSWYLMFPRSCGSAGVHGTFSDCEPFLQRIAEMGFDVVCLPPIHPIGRTGRRASDGLSEAEPDDVGNPYAVGSPEGGHKSIHPALGTLDDFRQLMRQAADLGIEIALDLAFQCSPDHPYLQEHPEWFRTGPDGSVRRAESPPRVYPDIVPFDFETADVDQLWQELQSIVEFWIEQGVRIFRADLPQQKPFAFWEWLLKETHERHPDVVFLADGFTRPAVLELLGKVGFSQCCVNFPWRNTKTELTEYFTRLEAGDVRDFLCPSAWPNTPDVLSEFLQTGGRTAFRIRLVLAATLAASYGVYGPAFELCETGSAESVAERYAVSERYALKEWAIGEVPDLRDDITRINDIRRRCPALQGDGSLRFHSVENEQIIGFSKRDEKTGDLVLIVVNLDPFHAQSGWLELPLEELGLPQERSFEVHDLASDRRHLWSGPRNFVELNPAISPACIFEIRGRVPTESDFEYFL
jgi:starch synthase (maltosyl-transferring)